MTKRPAIHWENADYAYHGSLMGHPEIVLFTINFGDHDNDFKLTGPLVPADCQDIERESHDAMEAAEGYLREWLKVANDTVAKADE